MQVDYTIPENANGNFEVFDIAGKKVLSYPLKGGHNAFVISNTVLENGIYIYQLSSGEKIIGKDKLVIIK